MMTHFRKGGQDQSDAAEPAMNKKQKNQVK